MKSDAEIHLDFESELRRSSCFGRLLAEQTAWPVPGVSDVKNELTLRAA